MKITQDRILELRASVAHADMEAIKSSAAETTTAEQIEDFNTYLHRFAAPEPDGQCVACGHRSTFQWGLQHGHGACYNCRWPGVLYHFIKDRNGKEVVIRGLLLWYHPDEIDTKA